MLAVHTLADAVQDFLGGPHADIGADERVFELVQQVGVDFLPALQDVFEPGNQAGARLLHAAFEFFQQGWLLRDGAE